ncbi:MAG: PKD domain-containing protein, partial [Thermoplasmata archaeon]|nr:PKD domain-containing protein [Thermoplasmata archaeon]
VMYNCTNFTVRGQHFTGAKDKFRVFNSNNGTFYRNHFDSRGGAQLILDEVWDMTVEKNLFTGARIGFAAMGFGNGVIKSNYFINYSYSGLTVVNGHGSRISQNYVRDADEYGMQVVLTDACTITENNIDNCTGYGLGLSYHDNDDLVHHNYFVNCNLSSETGLVQSPQCENGYYDNQWNTSTEGNYWSDYEDRYPEATNDGITWSIPYEMTSQYGTYHDNHPLVSFSDTVPPLALVETKRVANIHGDHVIDGTTSLDNVGIIMYEWTIEKDGSEWTVRGAAVSVIFNELGIHNVTLRVEDAAGLQDEVNITITVKDMEPPVAYAGEDVHVDMGELVELDGTISSDNHAIANYHWRFYYNGTLVESDGPSMAHRFDHPGEYEVKLRVTDPSGLYSEDSVLVFVKDTEPPVIVAGGDVVIDQGEVHSFSAVGSKDNVGITSWRWTLEYQDIVLTFMEPSFSFRYDVPGRYVATINISDAEGNWMTMDINVTVRDTQKPVANAGTEIEIDQYETCHFDGTFSLDNVGVVNWTWSFEYDGEMLIIYGPTPTFVFEQPDEYEVILRVYDGDGNIGRDTTRVTVRDIITPMAKAGSDFEIDMGSTVQLNGSQSTDNVGIVDWTWEFDIHGTLVRLTGEKVDYTFEEPGEFTI